MGIERINQTFRRSGADGRPAIIGYLTTGFPTQESFLESVSRLFESGVDILELGVPFSDPVADGAVIQKAGDKAISLGITLRRTLELAGEIRRTQSRPIVLMSYFNPIYRLGFERFVKSAIESGVDGVIIPDLLPEEATKEIEIARDHDFALIFLAASNGSDQRLKSALSKSTGFLYALGLEGVTGERKDLDPRVLNFLGRLKELRAQEGGTLPIAVGFGISRGAHVAALRSLADGVIVGSAFVRRAAESPDAVEEFARELVTAAAG